MAAPVYSNDLTTIATGDLNYDAGTWDESTDGGWDTAGTMVDDEDLWYVDTKVNTSETDSSCVAAQYTKTGVGSGAAGPGTIMYNHNASFTVPADGIVSIDNYWAAPPALNPYVGAAFLTAEAGVSVLIGSSLGDFDVHYVAGSDKRPPTDGVYSSYFVDPTVTPAGTVGTVGALTMVGIAIAAGPQARGNPNACQSVRYGRGEVSYTAGDAITPAKFEGYAAIDNLLADKFNLLLMIEGGYKGRGLMTFGTATTAVYFEDSDVNISIADDPKVGTNFNKGAVNNAASTLKWTNVSITNLGTVSRYTFTVNDNATTVHTGCVFTDLGAFTYGTNSTNANVTYRRQEVVKGGSYDSCAFDKASGIAASVAASLNSYDNCTFISSGTGFGVDLTDGDTVTISTNTTMNWDNTSSGYTDTADNRTIKVNVDNGVTFTINNNTGDTIYVQNEGTGTVNIVTGQKTLTITTQDGNEVRIRQGSYTLQHTQDVTGGQVGYTYTYVAGTYVFISVGGAGFVRKTIKHLLSENNATLDVTLDPDPSYI